MLMLSLFGLAALFVVTFASFQGFALLCERIG